MEKVNESNEEVLEESAEEIEEEVWEYECMSLKSLRTTIGFLRKKLPFNAISNVSNMGYKLKLDL